MKNIKCFINCFFLGALVYSLIELAWRGRTHWSMAVTGGTCFSLLCRIYACMTKRRLWEKCLIGSAVISAIEFIAGYLINIKMKWKVWDYSHLPLNIMGQICPLYSAFWFVLCVPINALARLF